MYVEYEEQCGNCVYYDFQGDNEKGYCSYYRKYFYPGDSCSHQEAGKSSSDSSCYITTIVCDILKYGDHCGVLESLRNFRNNIMQKNEKYKELLFEYDSVGPQIAKNLREDYLKSKDSEIAKSLFDKYIMPTSLLIKEEKYEEAVEKYSYMTEMLKDYYGLTGNNIPQNYDYKNGGHGKVLIIDES